MDLSVCLLWHMHQPVYLDAEVGEYLLPWVFLHGVKDYYEMARHLEAVPEMHLTVNFVPSLLDQLEAYGPPGSVPNDRFLRHYLADPAQMETGARDFLIHNFFSAHLQRQILPSPRYGELFQTAHGGRGRKAASLDVQDLLDLQVWFLLAWCGDTLREEDPFVAGLIDQDRHFTAADKRALLTRLQEVIAEVVPRYRALAERGQIELSFTPYYHPILPLLCDTDTGAMSNPATHLPRQRLRRPGDAAEQVRRALRRHQEAFGAPPRGCWPSEGSLSQEVVELLATAGVGWAATDERVLFASLAKPGRDGDSAAAPVELYRAYRAPGAAGGLTLFFRDQPLSDRIGFTYSHWDEDKAVTDFLDRLREIQRSLKGRAERPVVSIILDGENAWEFYRANGRPFLLMLYRALVQEKGLVPHAFGEALAAGCDSAPLERLHPGSWINANFNIWVGHPEKNLAWEWVSRGVEALENDGAAPPAARDAAYQALLAAEGSDWFWWFGDDHYSAHDTVFDHLFRTHLREVYRRLDLEVPEGLHIPIARIRRAQLEMPKAFIQPIIDGRGVYYLDWISGGRLDLCRAGAMHPGECRFTTLRFGFDAGHLYLRLEASVPAVKIAEAGFPLTFYLEGSGTSARVRLDFNTDQQPHLMAIGDGEEEGGAAAAESLGRVAVDEVLEIALPFAPLGFRVGDTFHLSFNLDGEIRLPLEGPVELVVPAAGDYLLDAWMV
ncbi:MAG TPA: glycoside hydrolase family 57 protein [bacterium]